MKLHTSCKLNYIKLIKNYSVNGTFKLLLIQTKSCLPNKNTNQNKQTYRAYFYIRVLYECVNLKIHCLFGKSGKLLQFCKRPCFYLRMCGLFYTFTHTPRAPNQSASNFMWFISSDNAFFIRIRLCTWVCVCWVHACVKIHT